MNKIIINQINKHFEHLEDVLYAFLYAHQAVNQDRDLVYTLTDALKKLIYPQGNFENRLSRFQYQSLKCVINTINAPLHFLPLNAINPDEMDLITYAIRAKLDELVEKLIAQYKLKDVFQGKASEEIAKRWWQNKSPRQQAQINGQFSSLFDQERITLCQMAYHLDSGKHPDISLQSANNPLLKMTMCNNALTFHPDRRLKFLYLAHFKLDPPKTLKHNNTLLSAIFSLFPWGGTSAAFYLSKSDSNFDKHALKTTHLIVRGMYYFHPANDHDPSSFTLSQFEKDRLKAQGLDSHMIAVMLRAAAYERNTLSWKSIKAYIPGTPENYEKKRLNQLISAIRSGNMTQAMMIGNLYFRPPTIINRECASTYHIFQKIPFTPIKKEVTHLKQTLNEEIRFDLNTVKPNSDLQKGTETNYKPILCP